MKMPKRLILHERLKSILRSVGQNVGIPEIEQHLYASPPSVMKFPCILYKLDGDRVAHADNDKYITHDQYTVTVIDEKLDSELVDALRKESGFSFNRLFSADGLNHFVFKIYV